MKFIILIFTACFILTGVAFSQPPPSGHVKTINAPNPVFPDEAKNYIYGESVAVSIDVDKKGKVTRARAFGPLAPCSNLRDKTAAAINKAALAAAKATTFEPIMTDGKPADVTLQVSYPLRPAKDPLSPRDEQKMVKGGVLNGKALSLPAPELPSFARANRISGSVQIQVLIGENGRVLSAAAISGHPQLREGALLSACGARFAEVRLSGQLVRVSGVLTYNFVQ